MKQSEIYHRPEFTNYQGCDKNSNTMSKKSDFHKSKVSEVNKILFDNSIYRIKVKIKLFLFRNLNNPNAVEPQLSV